MTVEKINKWCDNCPHVACETCEITWTDIEELKKDIKENYILKDKVRNEIEKLKDMKVSGEVFTTAVNFSIKILKDLLEENNNG